MDENKKQDGLFHWNFDLKDTDSDFTDIEYSADTLPKAEGENDIKPFIFVDGNYKSEKDSASFAESFVQNKKEEPEEPAEEKPARRPASKFSKTAKKKKEKTDSGKSKGSYLDGKLSNIRWKPILIAAGIIALIVLLLVIFWPKKDEKEWEVNTDKEITDLITAYFKAKTDGDASSMRRVLVTDASVSSVALAREARLYQAYNNIKTYSYPGMKNGETALLVTYDSKFVNIDTEAPTMAWFYAKPDATAGELRLMSTMNGMSEDSDEYKYIVSAYEKSTKIQDVSKSVQDGYEAALKKDDILAYYIDLWKRTGGNEQATRPETTPVPSTEVPGTTAPTESTAAPTLPLPTDVPVDNEVKVDYCAYISDDGVRMRRTPTTDTNDNIITSFNKGYYLQVIGELDGWYHVRDNQNSNGMGQTQNPSGQEGYVSKDFIAKYYNQLGN